MKDHIFSILILLMILLVLGIGIWVQFFAPCSWQFFRAQKDLPARCFTNYEGN